MKICRNALISITFQKSKGIVLFNLINPKFNISFPAPKKSDGAAPKRVYPNLQPLKQDTISFKGLDSKKVVNNEDRANFAFVGPIVRKVNAAAQPEADAFERTLKDIFGNCCSVKGNTPQNCLGELKFNRKSERSLREKCASNGITTEAEAKDKIRDIIRARIVIEDTQNSQAGKTLCDKLIKAVNNKKVNIVNIKNYYEMDKTFNKGEDMQYIPLQSLLKLDKAVTDSCGESALKSGQTRDNGYNAVHIIFKLGNGFYGELQIMGKNVEKMKEIEDIVYKIKGNKFIDPKYEEIKKVYLEEIDKKPKKEAALDKYTRLAYNAERLKELGKYTGREKTEFLPLPPEAKLPEIFDYNALARVIRIKSK